MSESDDELDLIGKDSDEGDSVQGGTNPVTASGRQSRQPWNRNRVVLAREDTDSDDLNTDSDDNGAAGDVGGEAIQADVGGADSPDHDPDSPPVRRIHPRRRRLRIFSDDSVAAGDVGGEAIQVDVGGADSPDHDPDSPPVRQIQPRRRRLSNFSEMDIEENLSGDESPDYPTIRARSFGGCDLPMEIDEDDGPLLASALESPCPAGERQSPDADLLSGSFTVHRDENTQPPEEETYQRGGTIFYPMRGPEVPAALQRAEERLAWLVARGMHDPSNEGLHSATFDVLLQEYLLPRIRGRDRSGQSFAIEQYFQLPALRTSTRHKETHGANEDDYDDNAAERIAALLERRLPDGTTMIIFKKKKVEVDGRKYRMTTHIGPKICITEVKSVGRSTDAGVQSLDRRIRYAIVQAHFQNTTAAQFLFAEDKRLTKVAGFLGAGPGWSYTEYYRTFYLDVHGMPEPKNAKEAKKYKERTTFDPPTVAENRKSEYDEPLSPLGAPPPPPPDEYPSMIGALHPYPATAVKHIFGKNDFLYILDEEGRTFAAFDVIVQRIRSWYEERSDRYHLDFDEDPYAPPAQDAATGRKGKGRAR